MTPPAGASIPVRVTLVETIQLRLTPRQDYRWAGLQVGLGTFVIVRVRSDQGLVGYGETVPLIDWGGDYARYAGESAATVQHVIQAYLAPATVGRDVAELAVLVREWDRRVRGHPYAKVALEIALFDLLGKARGVPVYELLGGRFRGRVPIAHMIGLMPVEAAIAEAEGAVAEGVKALQVKGGVDPERDISVVREVRRAVGDGIVLRLDANQGYGTAKPALRILNCLQDAGVDVVEQPVEGLAEMAKVTRQTPGITILADESAWTPRDALDVVLAGAADGVSVYVAKAGGLTRARMVASIAEAAGLPCDVNGSIELGIANAASLHLAAAAPAMNLASVIPVNAPSGTGSTRVAGRYYADDVVCEPFVYDHGDVLVPSGTGLCIEVDESKLERYRVE
ncbi:MAG TPA: enolase C-terminal domain-like protein [Chloroflexota bacterium]